MTAAPNTIHVVVSVLTAEKLAAALQRVGPSDIEQMAWSPMTNPVQYVGDPDDNLQAEDPYPMASLAAAILRELEA